MLDLTGKAEEPRVLLLNKINRIGDKSRLLLLMERYAKSALFTDLVPVSALTGDGCDRLLDVLWEKLPEGPPLYDSELLTIHPERFLVADQSHRHRRPPRPRTVPRTPRLPRPPRPRRARLAGGQVDPGDAG